MASLILPEQTRLDTAALITAAGGTLAGVLVALYKADINPTDKTVFADVIGAGKECDYDGYARSGAIVWGPDVYYSSTGVASIYGDVKNFQSAAVQTKPQNIMGVALIQGGTVLRGVMQLDAPVPIVAYPDGFPFIPRYDFAG